MIDKRTVFTDALETLGTLIDGNQKRDAIHLAVEPIIAGEILYPGQDIGIGEDGLAYASLEVCTNKKHLGIVDPFLKSSSAVICHKFIETGQRFWMIIYPRKITSLRHVWEHPDIPDNLDSTLIIKKEISDIDKKALINTFNNNSSDPHPAHNNNLVESVESVESLEWIKNYAASLGNYTAHDLIEAAKEFLDNEEYYYGDYDDETGWNNDLEGMQTNPEFWTHFEIITGKKVPENKKENFFSCSC